MLHSNCCVPILTGVTSQLQYEGLPIATECVWVCNENLKWVETSAIVFLSASQTYKERQLYEEKKMSTVLYRLVSTV